MEQSELNKILASHKLWIETNSRRGKRADLNGADLNGANLERANLECATLISANLAGANLSDANLECADLRGANLTGVNLKNADLRGVFLSGADLNGADLNGADLDAAYLEGANLLAANLEGAYLTSTCIKDAVGLPDVSWIEPGCLVQLINTDYSFYSIDCNNWINFSQDRLGLIIKLNPEEKTFDILISDRIIRGIPDWVKYSIMKKVSSADIV